ncbi:MAG: 23S rRNA (adenine(2503)-C(2))-methyltransferase RlmN [Oscillospiraceae bacterium]
MGKLDIKSMLFEELSEYFAAQGFQKFRAKQVFDWLHAKQVESFSEMTNLPNDMLKNLEEQCYVTALSIERKLISSIDETAKYLFKLPDGELVETVLMKYKHGNSVCVSTQVGCKMGCSFCASTKAGFVRNLTASEILEQIYKVQKDSGERISNVVLMGIGEPLDNYDNVVKFLKLISDDRGNNLSLRHLSLSTCGVVDKIYELAELKLGLTLSISLHAPTNALREQTMPINKKYNIEELLKACRHYAKVTSRRISFEYALIKDVNDSQKCADELAALLRGMLCHVNLIPVNEIKEISFQKSDRRSIESFSAYLNNKGINTTIRRTLGTDISAACGQLRRENIE